MSCLPTYATRVNAQSLRTFADSLLCAHGRAILHCVQREVDLRDLPVALILNRSHRILRVLAIIALLTVHLAAVASYFAVRFGCCLETVKL